jgi:hypothetical protein
VRFQLDPTTHPIVIFRDDIQAVSITQAHGTLQVSGQVSRMGIAWAGWGYGIISVVHTCLLRHDADACRLNGGTSSTVSLNIYTLKTASR